MNRNKTSSNAFRALKRLIILLIVIFFVLPIKATVDGKIYQVEPHDDSLLGKVVLFLILAVVAVVIIYALIFVVGKYIHDNFIDILAGIVLVIAIPVCLLVGSSLVRCTEDAVGGMLEKKISGKKIPKQETTEYTNDTIEEVTLDSESNVKPAQNRYNDNYIMQDGFMHGYSSGKIDGRIRFERSYDIGDQQRIEMGNIPFGSNYYSEAPAEYENKQLYSEYYNEGYKKGFKESYLEAQREATAIH